MSVALSPVAASAAEGSSAELRVERVDGLSAITCLRSSGPLRLLSPRMRGPSAWVYLGSLGGGVVAGDQTSLCAEVGKSARLFLGSQSSNKLYRSDHRPCSAHEMTLRIGEGAVAIVAPDVVQAFARSTYRQSQEVHLHPEGGLLLLDWFSSGRVAQGEKWNFAHLELRNRV
ncbi:MAG: urease accessory protein UreD, partial [Verrucomicrobia bacterium]|nr:urease accessory protein UreD [Verrucomicrobiota bacterium]